MSDPTESAASLWFADVVATGAAVAATSARSVKIAAIAALLARTTADDMPAVIGFLVGAPRQGRMGVGWATAFGAEAPPAAQASCTVREIDDVLTELAAASGVGSVLGRDAALRALYARCTAAEIDYLRRLFVGELRQGALAGVVTDALAAALAIAPAVVRRAAMLLGDLGATAALGRRGGEAALRSVTLQVGRPVQPMLASPAADLDAALAGLDDRPMAVEWKLDGIRVQVHKHHDDVRVYTRNLNDITDRVPEIVEVARTLPASLAVLDGEAMAWRGDGAPIAFQHTMSRVGREDDAAWDLALRPFFFDCLHVDGRDLLDEPLAVRREQLARIAGAHAIPGAVTDDRELAVRTATEALDAGHEGVVVKDLDSVYEAGRRGRAWRKVKPVRTFDLVVLAAEWGHGRRTGSLSNLHLGARADDGGFVMVGKTFKGLTDALLAWQTERFLAIEHRRTASTVFVRPEMVVEIAIDGVQASRRYPGGVALRFARVKRYREDKSPQEADLLTSLQALLPGR